MANGKTLVVVESPAKAKTIEKYLGGDYAVRASYGHIRDLGKGYGGLGVDVEHAFTPDYVVPEDSKRHVGELKKVAEGRLGRSDPRDGLRSRGRGDRVPRRDPAGGRPRRPRSV